MKKIILVSMVFLFTGCEGDDDKGSTSSGSGTTLSSASGAGATADFSAIAGTYAGTATGTATASPLSGVAIQETRTYDVVVVINNNGQMTLTADGEVVQGQLGPDRTLSVTQDFEIVKEDGDRCQGPVTYSARVEGTRIIGDLSGDGACVYQGTEWDVDINGDLEAVKQA